MNNTYLGGFDPSTPYQHAKKRKAPASRPVAGPSNAKVPRITRGRKQKSTRDSPVVVEDDDKEDDDDVPEVVQPATRNGATAKVPPSLQTNGKSASKAKGKGKGPPTNGHRNGTEFVVIDELDDDDLPPAKLPPSTKKGKSPAGSTDSTKTGSDSRELEKLREERDLVRLSNISAHFFRGYSRSSCSTKKRANSYPKPSSS